MLFSSQKTGVFMNLDSMIKSNNLSAMRIVASVLGALVGFAGIEHGLFEVLQGNTRPSGFFIEAIGPDQRFWQSGTERAVTIIPNFFITGILAMILGFIVMIWALKYIDRKNGALILLLLSILLFLVGGGFAPIFMAILAVLAATRIRKPLTWWQEHLPINLRNFLAAIFPLNMIIFVLMFFISVEIAIFGYPLVAILGEIATESFLWNFSYIMTLLMVGTIFTGIAYDIKVMNMLEGE
jgi:hypothetical protein